MFSTEADDSSTLFWDGIIAGALVDMWTVKITHFILLQPTVSYPCKQNVSHQPFDTDTAVHLVAKMTVLFQISCLPLGAAEHLWLCANCCAKGNSEEDYNHDYLSQKAAGKWKTTSKFHRTELLPPLSWHAKESATSKHQKRFNRWSGAAGSRQLKVGILEACCSACEK